MPTYGYRCTACGHEFERFQKITDDPVKTCEQCEAPVKKILYPVGISFKGDGFHVNDYKKSGGSTKAAESAPADTKPAETKTETKTETKPTPSSSSSD